MKWEEFHAGVIKHVNTFLGREVIDPEASTSEVLDGMEEHLKADGNLSIEDFNAYKAAKETEIADLQTQLQAAVAVSTDLETRLSDLTNTVTDGLTAVNAAITDLKNKPATQVAVSKNDDPPVKEKKKAETNPAIDMSVDEIMSSVNLKHF